VKSATVPMMYVVVINVYRVRLYAMTGTAFQADFCIALTSVQIAVMRPEAAVNPVYAKKKAEIPEEDRTAFIKEKQDEYNDDIDIYRLASEMVVDAVVEPEKLRDELIKRYRTYDTKNIRFTERKHGVYPV